MLYGGTVDPFMGRHPWLEASTGSLLLAHPVDVVGARKGSGADFLGIALDRPFDRGPEFAEPLDEFRHPRRQPEHVLEHEDLAVAGHAGADADGGDRDLFGDAPPERLGDRFEHHGECPGISHRARSDPMVLMACGVSPTCPITGTPRSTKNAMVSAMRRPPSTLMAPQPVSFKMRAADMKACSREAS